MHYQDVLATAINTIHARGRDYGDVLPSFVRAASIASALLDRKITAFDIAAVMIAVKMSRIAQNKEHEDSWVDLVAYTSFAAQFAAPHSSDFSDIVAAQAEAVLAKEFGSEAA